MKNPASHQTLLRVTLVVFLLGPITLWSAHYIEFHRPWCNSKEVPKSCVNEALQLPPNVLLSGPFKKSFPASHGMSFIHRPARYIQGQISGNQAIGRRKLDAKHSLCANREPLSKTEWMNRSGT